MGLSLRVRTGAAVAAAALAVPVLPAAVAGAAVRTATVQPSSSTPSAERLLRGQPTAAPSPTTTATPGSSVPSEADVSEARDAAAAAAEEVAAITAKVARAEERLDTLQREVAEAVGAHERARQRLAAAQAAVRQATADLASARRDREDADRALSGRAALMYMQGGDLQDLTTLLLSPPGVMSDLVIVLDQNAHRARASLDAARSTAAEAAATERLLVSARDDHTTAAAEAGVRRTTAEKKAEQASAEAARLGEQQESLTARLAVLEKGAADLAGLREAAARRVGTDLLGMQADGSPASGPRAAQEIARSMLASHGWDEAEHACLVALWHGESGWSWSATNPSSGAYGIPQALPGWKMAGAGSDWLTNPATQIAWGMDYIASVYGSPCAAHDRWLARSPHWY